MQSKMCKRDNYSFHCRTRLHTSILDHPCCNNFFFRAQHQRNTKTRTGFKNKKPIKYNALGLKIMLANGKNGGNMQDLTANIQSEITKTRFKPLRSPLIQLSLKRTPLKSEHK